MNYLQLYGKQQTINQYCT